MLAFALSAALIFGAAPEKEAFGTAVMQGPQIDGDLRDEVWAQAKVVSDFKQEQPDNNREATQRTEVRILHDDKYIYFGVHCFDTEPKKVMERLTRRDRFTFSDEFGVEIDSEGQHSGAFIFTVSPAGVQRDILRSGENSYDDNWDAVWNAAAKRDSTGWTAEMAIPLSTLRFHRGGGDWRLQMRRIVGRRVEVDAWVVLGRDETGELQRYGVLHGMTELSPQLDYFIRPFVFGRWRNRNAPPELGDPTGTDWAWSLGGEAHVGITSGLKLDATVLPDFGQVEADQTILNLSTFEFRFPEKRPFFLEGSDLFSLQNAYGGGIGTQLFYSRRIGAGGLPNDVRTSERLVDIAERQRIFGAVKLTGSIGSKTRIAVLDTLTAPEKAIFENLQDGTRSTESIAAQTNYFVARMKQDLGEQFALGATFTNASPFETANSMGRDDGLCPGAVVRGADGKCTPNASAAALDLGWRSKDGGWVANGIVMGSYRLGGPDKSLSDGTVLTSNSTGLGWRVEAAKSSGKWLFDANYEAYSPKLDLNKVGFLRSGNVHQGFLRGARKFIDFGPTRQLETGLEYFIRQSWDGVPLARTFFINAGTQWKNDWNSWSQISLDLPRYDNRDTEDGARLEKAPVIGFQWWVETNPTKPVVIDFNGDINSTLHGYVFSGDLGLQFRPQARFDVYFGPSLYVSRGDWRFYSSTPAPNGEGTTWTFGDQDATNVSLTLRSTVTFTPNLSLQAYGQLFFATVDYSNLKDISSAKQRPYLNVKDMIPSTQGYTLTPEHDASLNVNAVLRWEYLPGSVFYLVYTRAHNGTGVAYDPHVFDWQSLKRAPTEDIVMAKLSYYFAG